MSGQLDSPARGTAAADMPTLQELYDYLISGTPETVTGSFEDPAEATHRRHYMKNPEGDLQRNQSRA